MTGFAAGFAAAAGVLTLAGTATPVVAAASFGNITLGAFAAALIPGNYANGSITLTGTAAARSIATTVLTGIALNGTATASGAVYGAGLRTGGMIVRTQSVVVG